MLRPRHNSKFRTDATYILSGGLGGLGQAIALWMAERGARNLILLSRRGMRGEHEAFRRRLESQGVHIAAPPCDVCDMAQLKETLNECLKSMPAMKGCIQATAELKVRPFL